MVNEKNNGGARKCYIRINKIRKNVSEIRYLVKKKKKGTGILRLSVTLRIPRIR